MNLTVGYPFPYVVNVSKIGLLTGTFLLDVDNKRICLGRNSPRRGYAGMHSNNRIPISSLAILRPVDPQRQSPPVPPSDAEDVRATHPSEVLLQYAEPGSAVGCEVEGVSASGAKECAGGSV